MMLSPAAIMVKKKLSGWGGISVWPAGGNSTTGGRVEQDKTTSANKKKMDLFGNPVGSLASLAVFRLSACKTAVFIRKLFRN